LGLVVSSGCEIFGRFSFRFFRGPDGGAISFNVLCVHPQIKGRRASAGATRLETE